MRFFRHSLWLCLTQITNRTSKTSACSFILFLSLAFLTFPFFAIEAAEPISSTQTSLKLQKKNQQIQDIKNLSSNISTLHQQQKIRQDKAIDNEMKVACHQRMDILEDLVQTDPQAALELALPETERIQFPQGFFRDGTRADVRFLVLSHLPKVFFMGLKPVPNVTAVVPEARIAAFCLKADTLDAVAAGFCQVGDLEFALEPIQIDLIPNAEQYGPVRIGLVFEHVERFQIKMGIEVVVIQTHDQQLGLLRRSQPFYECLMIPEPQAADARVVEGPIKKISPELQHT